MEMDDIGDIPPESDFTLMPTSLDEPRQGVGQLVRPGTWAPYQAWEKHRPPAKWDLAGSHLVPCSMDDLPGAEGALVLDQPNEEGYPPLVRALSRRYGVDVSRITLATGGSGAYFQALAALVRPGDRVIIEWPGYDVHPGVAQLLGAEIVPFTREWGTNFAADADSLAQIITSSTRAVVLTNPHDPTGVYTDRASMEAIGSLAGSVGAKVIVDEVHLDALSDVDTTPAALFSDNFISVNSLTKSYGLAGLRVGWMISDPETAQRAKRVRDIIDGTGSVPSERLAVVAVGQMERLLERARRILEPNRAKVVEFVESRDELAWVAPAGGAVAFPKLKGVQDAEPFVEMARTRYGVGLVPGSLYGYRQHFRLAFGGDPEILEGGLEALGKALDRGTE